jgi:hypothetical protein
MNVLPSTWAFKIKWFTDGSLKKFKAQFCACGDRQKEGINFLKLGNQLYNGPQYKLPWCLLQN